MSLPIPPPNGVFSTHKANCHCGAIRVSFKISPPLESYPVVSCTCSVCQRNGYMFVYPDKDNVTLEISPGSSSSSPGGASSALGSYTFGSQVITHKFCKNCGSSVFFEFVDGKPPEVGEDKPKLPNIMGVNVRMITGVELEDLTVKKIDYMRDFGPKYTS